MQPPLRILLEVKGEPTFKVTEVKIVASIDKVRSEIKKSIKDDIESYNLNIIGKDRFMQVLFKDIENFIKQINRTISKIDKNSEEILELEKKVALIKAQKAQIETSK